MRQHAEDILNSYLEKIPNYWFIEVDEENIEMLRKYFKQDFICLGYTSSINGKFNSQLSRTFAPYNVHDYEWSNIGKVPRITTEQFKTHILKMKTTNLRTITPLQAQQIIEIACESWKQRLAKEWSYDIIMQNDIKIQEHRYQEMRKACTKEQHELFDKIFGVECPYKKDELIFVKDKFIKIWQLRYFSHMKGKRVCCYNDQITSKNSSVSTSYWEFHAKTPEGFKLPNF